MENAWFRMTLEMPEVPFRMRPLRPLTDEELERLSARQDVLHIEREPNGELEVRLVGGTIAGAVATDLMCELYAWSDDAGVGRVLPNVGYFLSDGSMRGPRVSWVPEVTYAVHKKREGDGFLRGAPPFVIEVVSSQRTPQEWRERMEIWMENGVELGWLFDLAQKTVEVYRAGRAMEERHEPATICGEGPITGFVLELGKAWW